MIGEREFFQLSRRIYDAMYQDAQGVKRPIARDMKEAQIFGMPNSSGKIWTRRVINGNSLISCNGREIWYAPQNDPGDISGLAVGLQRVYKSTTGLVQIFNPGIYYFCTPLIAGDVDGASLSAMIRDSAQGSDAQLPVNQIIGGSAAIDSIVNVAQLGGTAQTAGVDLGKLWTPVTWGATVAKQMVAADQLVLAANAARRGITIKNRDAAIVIGVGIGVLASIDDGIWVLEPGDSVYMGPDDFPPVGAIHAFGAAGGTANNLLMKEGT
jgi:hypothetical protein